MLSITWTVRRFIVIGAAFLCLAQMACLKERPVHVDGSSTVGPISVAAVAWYKAGMGTASGVRHPNANISVNISGTTAGFAKFCAGETDISDASRPITKEESSLCKQNGIDFVELPVAYDGISIVVNPKNTWASTITTAELKKLWEPDAEHKITRWSQVRADWPDRDVHLYGPGGASGTYDYFNEVILKTKKCRSDYTGSEDDDALVSDIASDEGALGYFGLAYYEKNWDKLALVSVDSGGGPVAPSVQTIRRGTYEPLSRPLFIYVSRKSFDRLEVSLFVDFYLDNAADLASASRYVALSNELYSGVRHRADVRKIGSAFDKVPKVEVRFDALRGTVAAQ